MKTIPGVPESLTREQYMSLVESVGFDGKYLRSLEFRIDGIYAEVFERNEKGNLVLDTKLDEPVINRVYIPVRDD